MKFGDKSLLDHMIQLLSTVAARVRVVAVDLPLLTPEFPQEFHSRFPVLTDNLSIRAFVRESNGEAPQEDEVRALGFDLAMFDNMNTPQDWERLTKRS